MCLASSLGLNMFDQKILYHATEHFKARADESVVTIGIVVELVLV